MPCDTKPEEYCIVTVDMSGAELRIIADLANAKSWIDAFNKGWDVHSVGTEILYPEKWPANTVRSLLNPNWWTLDTKELIPLFDDAGKPVLDKKTGLQKTVPPCAYYARDEKGDFARQKCECPKHKTLRNGNKSTNFLLCYGGGPSALADALGIAKGDAEDLYHLHESKFPDIWGYLKRSGQDARMKREARDMFGRRRLFPEPTWEQAKLWFMEEQEERLELDEELCEAQVLAFKKREFREPDEEELWSLTHRMPSSKEISSSYKGLFASIERRGKNMPIQGTNASIIKRSMGCGIAADGTPYLWHTLPRFKAKLLSMVHDELVIHCPKRFGEQVAKLVADAFKRAAAEVLKHVVMEADWHIAERWTK
jgi:DNA polymerase I-like protein with 3'-5' exonuclease and polymerase domains